MPNVIGDLIVQMGFDLKGVKAGVTSVEKQLKKVDQSVDRTNKSIKQSFDALKDGVQAIAGAVVVKSFSKMLKESANLADSVGKLSQRLGLSTEFLSEMRFALESSGISADTMATVFQRVNRRMGEFALTGGGEAAKAFEILGNGIGDAVKRGESLETLLPKIADAFAGLESDQLRLVAAFKLGDTEFGQYLQLLNQGGDAIKSLREEGRKFGVTITKDMAQKAADFNDALGRMGTAMTGLKQSAFQEAAPFITDGINSMASAISKLSTAVTAFTKSKAAIVKTIEDIGAAVGRSAGFSPGDFAKFAETPKQAAIERDLRVVQEALRRERERSTLAPTVTPEMRARHSNTAGPMGPPASAAAPAGLDIFGSLQSGIDSARNLMGDLATDASTGFHQITDAATHAGNFIQTVFTEQTLANLGVQFDATRQTAEEAFFQFFTGFESMSQMAMSGLQNLFQTFSDGLANAVVLIATEGAKASEVFKQLGKQLLKTVVQMIIRIATETLLGALIAKLAASIVGSSKIGTWAGVAYAATFASAIESLGLVGLALAPGLAGGAAAALIGGAKGAMAAGSAVGKGDGLAKGGIVNKPILTPIGEAGPEAVTPLRGARAGLPARLVVELGGDTVAEYMFDFMPGVLRRFGFDV